MGLEGLTFGLAASAALSIGSGWWALRQLVQARHLLDTPTSKIRSAAQGYAEFYGVLQEIPETVIVAPLTGTPCQWWRYRIEEYQGSGKSRSWRVVERGTSEAWLLLDDHTGQCLIDPRGALVRPATRVVWQGHQRHPRGLAKTGFFAALGLGREYRYTEERLHSGQPLYAIGEFRSSGGGRQGLDLDAAQRTVVSEWKGNFDGLLQRFDQNSDGQIDEQEWARVRLAARLEAEDRHRAQSAQPARHQLSKPRESQPFVLSCAGEDELARRFYWQAAAGFVLCLAGAVACAWLLGGEGF